MVSVVIPLYNKRASIEKTLHSLKAQTYTDFEVVIIDDGSTDESAEATRKVTGLNIRLFRQQNAGVSAARNRGIAEAKGEYIAFLDADDEWHKDYLQTMTEMATTYPDCDVIASNYNFCNHSRAISPTILRKMQLNGTSGRLTNYFEVASCSHPPLWTSAVMVRKSAIESVGGFPVGIKSGEDLLTWARLACKYSIAFNLVPRAIFNVEGYDSKERPKRIPADVDFVGKELKMLLKEYSPPYMKAYISLWHKMRSSIYMRLHMRKKSIIEASKGIAYAPLNYKLYVFICLNLLPKKLQPF